MKRRLIFLTLSALLWAGLVQAQGVTTGSMTGVVLDPNNEPLPGVTVVATLPATGNRYGAVTDADGYFRIVNAKVGGPYQVVASLPGFQTYTADDLNVRLGEATSLVIALQLEAATGEIEVVGESSPLIAPTKMGVASSVSQGSIEALPTIERSVYDMARTNPVFHAYSESDGEPTQLSISGRNPRYNNISIDGAVNNDVFGLADSGTPGGQSGTQPIQLDAVQEVQLVTSSYDVRQGGFTGGSVNIITKSGSNDYHGSLFGYTSSDSWVGSGPDDFPELGTYEDSEYGFTLGGRMIRDKLFFFTSFGHNTLDRPTGWSLDGSSGEAWRDGDFLADAEEFRQFNIDNYGWDPGDTNEQTRETPNDKFIFRLDWNLNQSHSIVARYNYVDAKNIIARPDDYAYEWHNHAYDFKNETNSLVGQWNAVFGDSAFNELRVTYQDIKDRRGPINDDFPHTRIYGFGYGYWEAGTERFSTHNEVDYDIIEITDDFTFFAGDHEIVIGTHNELYSFRNYFIQYGFGYYRFDSLEDYYAGNAYQYEYTYPTDPDNPDDKFDTYQLGFYAGDTWRVKSNFTLVYGLRLDVPLFPDTPEYNPEVEEIYGVRTDIVPDGNYLWSPRVGFNWDISGDGTKQLRGGGGLFTGRTPYVWISNNYARTGTRQTNIYLRDFSGIPFEPDPYNQPTDVGSTSIGDINVVDPDFNFPQTWRANLAYDHRLPWLNMVATGEVMWAKSTNEVDYANLNIRQTGEFLPFDNRPIYEEVTGGSGVYYLRNTDDGDAFNATAKLELPYGQQPIWGIASYTYGESNVVNDATSSRAVSNWQYNEALDPNNATLSRSDFEVKHRVMINLNYEFNRNSRWSTTVSAFYNHQSGRPYMSIYEGVWPYDSINQDYFTGNDPIYVPSGADDVVITNGTWDQLEAYLERTGLMGYLGQVVPRGASTAPWITQTDLAIRQNIPIPGKSSLQFSIDIFNFWNLIDDESGHVRYVSFGTLTPIIYRGVTDDGKPIYELTDIVTDPDEELYEYDDLRSRWRLRFGLRWSF